MAYLGFFDYSHTLLFSENINRKNLNRLTGLRLGLAEQIDEYRSNILWLSKRNYQAAFNLSCQFVSAD